MKLIVAAAVLLCCSSAIAAPVISNGVDKKTGRHYVLTLTGQVSNKALPRVDGIVRVNSNLGAYLVNTCAEMDVDRCDVYTGLDIKRWLPAGYVFAFTKAGKTSYRSDAVTGADDPPTFACIPPNTPVSPVTGKDILAGDGPVVLRREGTGLHLSYNKGYRCKVEIDAHFKLIGSVVFGGK